MKIKNSPPNSTAIKMNQKNTTTTIRFHDVCVHFTSTESASAMDPVVLELVLFSHLQAFLQKFYLLFVHFC